MITSIKRVVVQIARGCTTLPHVGAHPGTLIFVMFILLAGLAGVKNGGVIGFLGGAFIMVLGMGPFYLYGAYSGAQLSDQLELKYAADNQQ